MLVQGFYASYIPERDYSELNEGEILARGRKAVLNYLAQNPDVLDVRGRDRDDYMRGAPRQRKESKPKAEAPKARKPDVPHSIVGLWSDGCLVRTFDPWRMKPEKILEAWKKECAKRPYEHLELGEIHPRRGRVGTISVRKPYTPLGRPYERPHRRWRQDKARDIKPWDLSTKVHTMAPRRF